MPPNANLQAVYTPRGIVTTARFSTIAGQAGHAVRFLSFGVFVDPKKFRGSKEPCETRLLCGWPEPEIDITREFDAACEANQREHLVELLKSGNISWIEFYVNPFDYAAYIQRKPSDQAKIDSSVPPDQLQALQAARSRYIFHNKSRRKTSQSFMHAVLNALAKGEHGVVANYVRPSR
jgi:hypothetical protein